MIDKESLKKCLKLYLVTDSEMLKGRDFYKCLEDAISSGITTVQLREKNASGREFLRKAMKLREITERYGVKFIINDRVDIALICDADGVHVGQSDIDVREVRKLIGNNKIIGVSARTLEEATCAKNDGADYLGVGSIFTTSTKLDAKSASFETVKEIKEKVDMPFVLIGGINLDNIDKLKCLESDGYAIISAILKAEDISKEVEKWTLKI
ncbi:thiamine phosphate synthase [Clostridioides difficile]|nr:thiamine phosphate synthase [Clostridioides difficile]